MLQVIKRMNLDIVFEFVSKKCFLHIFYLSRKVLCAINLQNVELLFLNPGTTLSWFVYFINYLIKDIS